MGEAEADISDAGLLDRLRRLERASRPLEPGTGRRRRLRNGVIASSERFLRRVDTLKGFDAAAGQGAGLLEHPVGERGMPLDEVIELFEREVVRPGAATATGRHLAYIPGGGIYAAALGDYLAAVTKK